MVLIVAIAVIFFINAHYCPLYMYIETETQNVINNIYRNCYSLLITSRLIMQWWPMPIKHLFNAFIGVIALILLGRRYSDFNSSQTKRNAASSPYCLIDGSFFLYYFHTCYIPERILSTCQSSQCNAVCTHRRRYWHNIFIRKEKFLSCPIESYIVVFIL